ncbi:MAG TPA: hypothetical protein EYP52_04865 [Anaerolineae bacterium]|nr:hypothetical protein [Anaerolineae bacterium]
MTNQERILEYLLSIAPDSATNSQIREARGIRSHQQVYLLTQNLMRVGLIRGERQGREWVFWTDEALVVRGTSPARRSRDRSETVARGLLSPRSFENLARSVMSAHFGVSLAPGRVPGVPKEFDMVSPDGRFVGDAKYFTLVQGEYLPSAKFSNIAEHIWLLEKTGAAVPFLVFGNDRRVPLMWLERYGHLNSDVAFFFISDDGALERLAGPS